MGTEFGKHYNIYEEVGDKVGQQYLRYQISFKLVR